jgi:Zn-dependent M28 family amino/carboxypeptidase
VQGLVEELCSDRCAGRATGTPGGIEARRIVVGALREAGLDPIEQALPLVRGANVLASVPGDTDRWVMIGAHYDHLGKNGSDIYRGADDNAASVAILVDLAQRFAKTRPAGRGVIFAAFDAEEPPHFSTGTMGSMHYARYPTTPLDRIDMMVCLELVGHSLGQPHFPAEARQSLFLLGAERSAGTSESVAALERVESGLIVRRADAEIIPPLSDYLAFWDRKRPFVLLTGGRSKRYHTPQDDPEYLDYARMAAVSRWIERFVRDTCARPEASISFVDRRDDASTVESIVKLLEVLAPLSPQAEMGLALARDLRAKCRAGGSLDAAHRGELDMLVMGIESGLA